MPATRPRAAADEVAIRTARPGDLGWTLQRQAVLYTEEYGWDRSFERHVAEGLAPFLRDEDPARDRLWVAEVAGGPVGAVAIQHDPASSGVAKLRWFFVEPAARGRGVGSTLLDTALAFAREAGYATVRLWTVDELVDARRAYERRAFRLLQETGCPWAPWARQQEWGLHLHGGTDVAPIA